MIFKKLEMHGFKSFYDKTEVHFQTGINAVVGPNGCGKSNIADAIRWVLGEQSPKQLRGEKMEDLIFSGSEGRRPLGMAEVSVTVETNGSDFPAPYSSFTELCVTRRLYRSGESEFFINNTSSRLRDIRELFLDTGMNPKAYAVIDQGSIGNIISSRPEDRRILIEEAAGIAKFKERKNAALRKLDATNQNMLRSSDVIRELKRQINSLSRQAKKAERYTVLRKEVEELELQILYRQYLSHRDASGGLRDSIKGMQDLSGTISMETSSTETALEAAKLTLVEVEKRVQAAREAFYTHRSQLEAAEHRLENAEARRKQLKETMERGRLEKERLVARQSELSEECRRIEEEQRRAEEDLSGKDDQARNLSDELRRATETSREIKERLEIETRRFLEEVRAEGESQNRVTQAETMREGFDRDLARLEEEERLLEDEERKLLDHEKALNEELTVKDRTRGEVRTALEKSTSELAGARADLERTEQRLREARQELSDISSRLASLNELEHNLSGWPERFEKELERIQHHNSLNGSFRGLLASFIHVAPEDETPLEAVLGEKLKYLLVNSMETAVDAARLLDESSLRGTFLPLKPRSTPSTGAPAGEGVLGPLFDRVTVEPDYRDCLRHLLQDVILVDGIERAVALWTEDAGPWTFVTSRGEVLTSDGALTGGRLDSTREILPLLRKIRTAKKEVGEKKVLVEQMEALRRQAMERIVGLESKEEELSEKGRRLEIEISSLGKDLAMTTQNTLAGRQRREGIADSMRRTNEEKEALQKKLSEELSRKSDLSGGREEREKVIASLSDESTAHNADEEELARRLNALQVEIAAGREKQSHLRDRLQRTNAESAHSGERCTELEEEIHRLEEKVKQETAGIEVLMKEKNGLAGGRNEFESLLASVQEEYRRTEGGVLEAEEKLRGLRLKADDVLRESADTKVKLAEFQVRMEHLEERIREVRQCHPDELWDEETRAAVLELVTEELEETLRIKSEKILSLGAVNMEAIGDQAEHRERLEFQQAQLSDLEKASEDLRQAIRKINRTSRERFIDTFEKVNEKFQVIFPLLFKDGHAVLRLTDAEDVLDAGIEVFAQPAGKSLQRISLLSGGEKALSAIALLLSIFMVKPTPFCLLDEVDAPLDESNTGRFLDVLGKTTNGSQLIVVTHNKRTMESASHLVGVTMSDPGISSLISVRLRNGASRN